MIEWKPYKFDLHRPILADQKKYTLLLAPICCMSAVHYHTPHYVHKQFEELEAVDLNQIMWTRPSRKRKQNRGPTAQKFLSESELQQWNNGMLVTNYLQGHKDDGMVDQPHVDSLVHVDQPERDVEEDQIDSEAATGSACATEDGMVDQPERRVDNAMVDLSESMHPLLQSTTLESVHVHFVFLDIHVLCNLLETM